MNIKIKVLTIIVAITASLIFSISCKKDTTKNMNMAQANNIKSEWKQEVDSNTEQFRKIYKEARKLQNEKDYNNAYDLFSLLDANYNILHDFVLYNRSEVAKNIPNEAAVISDLKLLITNYPHSPIASLATYSLGQAYIRIKDDENAKKYFEETITKYPKTDFAIASNYYIAEIYLKNPESNSQAIKHFKNYLKEAPDGKFAINCSNALIKLVSIEKLSDEDKKNIGLAYFNGGEYNKAIKYLSPLFNEYTWYALGKSYQLTSQYTKSIDTFSRAINSYSGLDSEEVDNAIKATAAMKGNNYAAWEYCEKTFPNNADVALYFKAQKLYDNQALPLYRKIINSYPNSRYAPESSWVVFWDMFNNKDYDGVIKVGQKHVKNYTDSKSVSRVIYWVGKAYERKGEKNNAIIVYERLYKNFPADYYGYRAQSRLNELKYNKKDNGWSTHPSDYSYDITSQVPIPIELTKIASIYGDKVAELIYLGDIENAKKALIENANPILESYFHLNEGLISKSIVTVRENQREHINNPPGKDNAWKLLFPLHYSKLIKQNASRNNLDPLLVQALTKEESYFNPQALSSSNAKGLMQLIPSTAKSVANWEKLNSFSQMDLFKPEINLRLGTRYLKYTHDNFSGNSMLAVASYNGGPGNVSKWTKTLPTNDWDQFVENIPLSETKNYVRKVFSSYWAYREIYANKSLLLTSK